MSITITLSDEVQAEIRATARANDIAEGRANF
jgi:hypothetical protein